MYLRFKKEEAKSIPARWKAHYGTKGDPERYPGTGTRLAAIPPDDVTVEAVKAAMAPLDWTAMCCDECGRDCDVLMHIGDEPDYEATYQDLCRDCLTKAVAMMTGGKRL